MSQLLKKAKVDPMFDGSLPQPRIIRVPHILITRGV